MKIFLNEDKLASLLTEMIYEYNPYDGNSNHNPYDSIIDNDMESLEKLIQLDGEIKINIENGKDYITYEITSLSNIIGKRYCLCRLIKDDEPYGSIYIKPMKLFKIKNY